jgi:hypothetical protein
MTPIRMALIIMTFGITIRKCDTQHDDSVLMLSVVMLNVTIKSVALNVVIVSVFMMNVMAPFQVISTFFIMRVNYLPASATMWQHESQICFAII